MRDNLFASRIAAGASALVLSLASAGAFAQHVTDPSILFERLSPSVWTVIVPGNQISHQGSAVVVDDGRLVTACNVLAHGKSILVTHANVSYGARLAAADAERDLCMLSVDNFHAPAVTIAPANTMKVGQRVYAIGSPFNRQNSLSDGLISGVYNDTHGAAKAVQFSAPTSPGSAGGGLFDTQGRLVAITTASIVPGRAENMNFGVPAEWIQDVPARAAVQLERHRRQQAAAAANAALATADARAGGSNGSVRQSGAATLSPPLTANGGDASKAPGEHADYERTTSTGREVLVSSHGAWNTATCASRFIPSITIVQRPAHGRLIVRDGDFLIGSQAAGRCDGARIRGTQVFYVSDSDYSGRDEFRYTSSGAPSVTKLARVNVQWRDANDSDTRNGALQP